MLPSAFGDHMEPGPLWLSPSVFLLLVYLESQGDLFIEFSSFSFPASVLYCEDFQICLNLVNSFPRLHSISSCDVSDLYSAPPFFTQCYTQASAGTFYH